MAVWCTKKEKEELVKLMGVMQDKRKTIGVRRVALIHYKSLYKEILSKNEKKNFKEVDETFLKQKKHDINKRENECKKGK